VLTIRRQEAATLARQQLEKAKTFQPDVDIINNTDTHRWYEYTEEVFRHICSNEELADEFTGKGRHFYGMDTTVRSYTGKLQSILDRLVLIPESVARSERADEPLDIIDHLVRRFHRVVRQLRQRHDNRPTLDVTEEYDVQDLLHALLALHFDDIRPEEYTPSYAGVSSRVDFLLKGERVVLEVKKTSTDRPKSALSFGRRHRFKNANAHF